MSAVEIPSSPRAPGDDGSVRLFGFTVGHANMPLSYFLTGEPGDVRIPVTAYLIDHPRGLALFDTGLGPRWARAPGTPLDGFIDLTEGETIDVRLRAIGVDPADIRWIVVSHLHSDHAGGNGFFPNATVVVHAAEHDHAFHGAEDDPIYHIAEYDTGQPFLKVDGEHDLFGDGSVVIFPTLGHTPGHQSARVRTDGGTVVLTGDCCTMQRTLDELRMPEHCHDADLFLGSLRQLADMRRRGAHVFPSHDPLFWARVPKEVPIDLAALRRGEAAPAIDEGKSD